MPLITFANTLPVDERILENVAASLRTISKANGYHFDIEAVKRYKLAGWQAVAFPTLMVIGVKVDKVAVEGHPARMNCVLTGAVASILTVDPIEDAEEKHRMMLLDEEACLQIDVQRGGNARDTTIIGSDFDIVEAESPFAVSTLSFQVKFTHARQDPTIAY